MFKQIVFTLLALLVAGHCISIQPFSLYDQAVDKLKELEEAVNIAISTAESELDSIQSSYNDHVNEVQTTTEIEIGDEATTIDGFLTTIKSVAISSGINIDGCLFGRESVLKTLPNITLSQLKSCLSNVDAKIDDLVHTTLKTVTETRNSVQDLYQKLAKCTTGSILCVTPVIRSTEEALIELPETIAKEIRTATELVETVTPEVDECSNTYITSYTLTANAIRDEINECVDGGV